MFARTSLVDLMTSKGISKGPKREIDPKVKKLADVLVTAGILS